MKPEDKPPAGGNGQDNTFQVTITYNGSNKTLEVNRNQSVQSVLARALALFPSAPRDFVLHTGGGPLPAQGSVEEAGIQPGAVLVLRTGPVQGG